MKLQVILHDTDYLDDVYIILINNKYEVRLNAFLTVTTRDSLYINLSIEDLLVPRPGSASIMKVFPTSVHLVLEIKC